MTKVVSALGLAACAAIASPAFAAPKDAAAQKLDASAMNDDFLSANFKKAEDKLRRALKECAGNGCDTARVEAQIHVHLGIVLVNAGKTDNAVIAFANGLKLNRDVTPDKEYVTPEVQKAFRAAKERRDAAPPPKAAKRADALPALKHEPVTESPTDTPVPIFVGGDSSAVKALLYYKASSGGEWKKVVMKKKGRGWGGAVPCGDATAAGTLRYYVLAQDSSGDPVAAAGSKKQPFEVEIKDKVSGEPPSFPDEEAPKRCDGKGGCASGSTDPKCAPEVLSAGAACTASSECDKDEGLTCLEGTCQRPKEGEGEPDASLGPSKNWLSLGLSVDGAVVSGSALCSADSYASGTYACFRSDGRFYKPAGANDTGGVGGLPITIATIRVLVGWDRIVSGNVAVGFRVGYAFGGGPDAPGRNGDKAFMPYHFEPRLTYWVGDDVLTRVGMRPYLFLGGGLAQVDAKIAGVSVSNDCELQGLCRGPRTPSALAFNADGTVRTHDDGSPVYITPTGRDISTLPAKGASKINVDAYRRMGTAFVGLGGGVMYALSKNGGLTLDVKLSYFFGSPGLAVSPTLGGIYGF